MIRRAWDLLVPVLWSGLLLGALQGAFSWYRHHAVTPPDTIPSLLSGALHLGVLTTGALLLPGLLLRRWHRAPTPLGRATGALLALAAAAGTWIPAMTALAPLSADGTAPGWVVGLLVALVMTGVALTVFRLPLPRERALRWGAAGVLVLVAVGMVFSLAQLAALRGRAMVAWAAEGPHPGPSAPDVVLVTVDTLRADRLGAYGGPPTPAFDRFAAEGVRFQHATASAPWTLPSLAGLHTGHHVPGTGVGRLADPRQFAHRSPVSADVPLLAEAFAAAGWRTAAIAGNAWTSPFFGLSRGFQRYDNPSVRYEAFQVLSDMVLPRLLLPLLPRAERGDDRARAMAQVALDWLAEPADRPLFLWVHFIDPHAPYLSRPDAAEENSMLVELGGGVELFEGDSLVGTHFAAVQEVRAGSIQLDSRERQRLLDLYDTEIAYTDAHVGRVLEALRHRERPVVAAFASDHGEEFWDHGGFEHAHDFYQETVRVPLVLWGQGVPAGAVVDEAVGLVDLGATLLDLAGLRPELGEGRSLVGTWTGAGEPPPPRFAELNLYGVPAVLVVDGPWHLILRAWGRAELYDVVADPTETHDLARERPEVVQRLADLALARGTGLEPLRGSTADTTALAAEVIEGLRALGYVQ